MVLFSLDRVKRGLVFLFFYNLVAKDFSLAWGKVLRNEPVKSSHSFASVTFISNEIRQKLLEIILTCVLYTKVGRVVRFIRLKGVTHLYRCAWNENHNRATLSIMLIQPLLHVFLFNTNGTSCLVKSNKVLAPLYA